MDPEKCFWFSNCIKKYVYIKIIRGEAITVKYEIMDNRG